MQCKFPLKPALLHMPIQAIVENPAKRDLKY